MLISALFFLEKPDVVVGDINVLLSQLLPNLVGMGIVTASYSKMAEVIHIWHRFGLRRDFRLEVLDSAVVLCEGAQLVEFL